MIDSKWVKKVHGTESGVVEIVVSRVEVAEKFNLLNPPIVKQRQPKLKFVKSLKQFAVHCRYAENSALATFAQFITALEHHAVKLSRRCCVDQEGILSLV